MATQAHLIMKIKNAVIRAIVSALQVDHGLFEITFNEAAINDLNQIAWTAVDIEKNSAMQEIAASIALQIEVLAQENKVVGLPDGEQWDATLIEQALTKGRYAAIAGKQFLTETVLAQLDEPLQTILRARGDDLSGAAIPDGTQRLNDWLKDPANLPIDNTRLEAQIALLAQANPVQLLSGGNVPEIAKYVVAAQQYLEIHHAISANYPGLAAHLQAQQAEIVTYLTINPLADVAAIVVVLKTANAMDDLRAAFVSLIGDNDNNRVHWTDRDLQESLKEVRFDGLLKAVQGHPQLVAAFNTHADVIKNKLAIPLSDAENYVDIAIQAIGLLDGATSFETIKIALNKLGLIEPAVNDVAATIVAENILLALPENISADNAAIKKLFKNQNIQNLLVANIKNRVPSDGAINFLQEFIKPRLTAIQEKTVSQEEIAKNICELLGIETVDAATEAALIKQCINEIYFKTAVAKYKPEVLNPLQKSFPEFMVCLNNRSELKESILSKVAGWDTLDWKLRTGFLMEALLKYTSSPRNYDGIRTNPSLLKFFNRKTLTAADLSNSDIDTLMGEVRLSSWLADKTPDFARLLKDLKLMAVNDLPETTAWAEMVRSFGAIPDAVLAKQKFAAFLDQCRAATQPAELWDAFVSEELIAADYVMPAALDVAAAKHAQAEMVLMEFEKFNPALVRWFRSNTLLWKHITQALGGLAATQDMFNILRGISYLLQHPAMQDPAAKRYIFTEQLSNVVAAFLADRTARVTAMFGGELPAISLGIERDLLQAVLSDSQLEMLAQSAAATTICTIMADEDLKENVLFSEHLDKITKRLQESRAPKGIFFKESLSNQLEKQAAQDDELYGTLMPLIKQVQTVAQTTTREEAFAACLHASVGIDAVRRYFAEKLQNLRYQLEASQNLVAQAAKLPNMKDFKAAEEALQKELIATINGYVKALQTIDAHMEQISAIIEKQQVQFVVNRGKTMLTKRPNDEVVVVGANDDIEGQISYLKNQATTKQVGLTAYTGGVKPPQADELPPGKQLVTVSNNITDASAAFQQHAFSRSIKNTGSGFVATIHEIPSGSGIFSWFAGVKDARAKALDVWTDELLQMSDEDYKAGSREKRLGAGVLYLNMADKDLLKDALVILLAKNKLRAHNGERVVTIDYSAHFENARELNKKIMQTFAELKQKQTLVAKAPTTKQVEALQEKTKVLQEQGESVALATGNRPGRAA